MQLKNKILFGIVALIGAMACGYLSYMANHSFVPEKYYYLLGNIFLILLSSTLGPGILISCIIGMFIGSYF